MKKRTPSRSDSSAQSKAAQNRKQFARTARKSDRFPIEKSADAKIQSSGWPVSREILFRPQRYEYIKKLVPEKGCVFCKAASDKKGTDSLKIFETELSMVVLNKYPYNNGHLLILPKKHVGDLLALSDEEYRDLHLVLRETLKVIKAAYEPQGVNLGMNLGKSSGGGIPEHLHYHVVPRWVGDSNFFSLIAQAKVVAETLEQTFGLLRPHFDRVESL